MVQAAGSGTTVAPLRTAGTSLIDARGTQIRLAGVNWYGAETPDLVPAGLQKQRVDAIAAEIKEAGFNSVRLPFSNYVVECDPVVSGGLVAMNPDYVGKHALAVYDDVVRALLAHGLMVILDDHSRDAQGNPGPENGLWHNARYSPEQWVADWVAMAGRFKDVRGVVGADLDNEPDWPSGSSTWNEWKSAAEQAGHAVNDVNPELLLMVEGVDTGTNISGAVANPVSLPHDKLVYSVHNYAGYDSLAGPYGYASRASTPLWVGELGTCNSSVACVHPDPTAPGGECLDPDRKQGTWFGGLTQYLAEHRDISWAYWPLNGTHALQEKPGEPAKLGPECYGLLTEDWTLPPRSDAPGTELLCALRLIEDPPGTCAVPPSSPNGGGAPVPVPSTGGASDRFAIDPQGMVGPLAVNVATQAAVINQVGSPDSETRGNVNAPGGGYPDYHALAYQCSSQSVDSCKTVFYISERSGLLTSFTTTDASYHTLAGVRVGMDTSTAAGLEHLKGFSECDQAFHESTSNATLAIAIEHGQSRPGSTGPVVSGGSVARISLEARKNSVGIELCY